MVHKAPLTAALVVLVVLISSMVAIGSPSCEGLSSSACTAQPSCKLCNDACLTHGTEFHHHPLITQIPRRCLPQWTV